MPTALIPWKNNFYTGIKKGFHAFTWIAEIVIPVSCLVTLLQWTGWLNRLDFIMTPLMSTLHLPPEAALPIISGTLINLYAGIAAITALPFTMGQMTLMSIFILIAHSLILEGVIQHKSGLNATKAAIIRITAAIATVYIVSLIIGNTGQSLNAPIAEAARTTLGETLLKWGKDTALLLLKILGIIMSIMVLQEFFKSLGWLDHITRWFERFMKVIGLSSKVTISWLAAIIFGLLYGGGVIIEEAKKGRLTREELENLQIFIGINHSMIEDPLLFAVLGLNLLWLWIPRLLIAVFAVQAHHVVKICQGRLAARRT
jgi:hypothetical protein